MYNSQFHFREFPFYALKLNWKYLAFSIFSLVCNFRFIYFLFWLSSWLTVWLSSICSLVTSPWSVTALCCKACFPCSEIKCWNEDKEKGIIKYERCDILQEFNINQETHLPTISGLTEFTSSIWNAQISLYDYTVNEFSCGLRINKKVTFHMQDLVLMSDMKRENKRCLGFVLCRKSLLILNLIYNNDDHLQLLNNNILLVSFFKWQM